MKTSVRYPVFHRRQTTNTFFSIYPYSQCPHPRPFSCVLVEHPSLSIKLFMMFLGISKFPFRLHSHDQTPSNCCCPELGVLLEFQVERAFSSRDIIQKSERQQLKSVPTSEMNQTSRANSYRFLSFGC